MNGEVLSEEVIPVRTRLAFALSESYLQHVQSRFEELERTSSPLFENVASDEHHQLSGSVLHTRPLLLVDQNYEV